MLSAFVSRDFKDIVRALQEGRPLPTIYKDHSLIGDFLGYRECHIKGDLLLVYKKDEVARFADLADIGTHSQIFG